MSIGENIKTYRRSKGLSQKELAGKLELSEITIRRYEKNIHIPSIETLNKMADIFDTTVNQILMDETRKKLFEESLNKAVDHIVEDIRPLVEYINKTNFAGAYDIKEIFSTSDFIDLGDLVDDIVLNRFRKAIRDSKLNK